jgi:hypothetical protein
MLFNRSCFSDRGSNQLGGLERRICFGGRGSNQLGGLESRICFSDRGINQSGGLECSCGSISNASDRAPSNC